MFKVNSEKVEAATLYLVHKQGPLSLLTLSYMLFCADKHHLNQNGRPITGDSYLATNQGPLPLMAKEIITEHKLDKIQSNKKPNLRKLSKSDTDSLDLMFYQIINLKESDILSLCLKEPSLTKTELNKTIEFMDMIESPKILEYLKNTGFSIIV